MGKAESETATEVESRVNGSRAIDYSVYLDPGYNRQLIEAGFKPYNQLPIEAKKADYTTIIRNIIEAEKSISWVGYLEDVFANFRNGYALERAQLILGLANLPGRPFTAKEVEVLAQDTGSKLENYLKGLYPKARTDDYNADQLGFDLLQAGVLKDFNEMETFNQKFWRHHSNHSMGGLPSQKFVFTRFLNQQNFFRLDALIGDSFIEYSKDAMLASRRTDPAFIAALAISYDNFWYQIDLSFLETLNQRRFQGEFKKEKQPLTMSFSELPDPKSIPVVAACDPRVNGRYDFKTVACQSTETEENE